MATKKLNLDLDEHFPACKSKWNSHMIITAPNKTPIAVRVNVIFVLNALPHTTCL